MRKPPDSLISRSLAALFGGYLIANLAAIVLAKSLFLPQTEALLAGMSASFAVYAGVGIWVFIAKTATQAWKVLTVIVLMLLVIWLSLNTLGSHR